MVKGSPTASKRFGYFVLVVSFAFVGLVLTLLSRADSNTLVAHEAEDSGLSGAIERIRNDDEASGQQAILFSEAQEPSGDLSQIPADPRPTVETETFDDSGDIADDSVIYANPSNPAKSVVIADNKDDNNGGIGVFDMQGRLLQFRQDGEIGNVDLRSGFDFDGRSIVLVGGNNRTDDTIEFWEYDPDDQRLSSPISSGLDSVSPNYGFCMYESAVSGKFYAFVTENGRDGTTQQFELSSSGGQVQATMVRSFNVGSISEGCVADDELGILYIAEENDALWRYDAEPDGGSSRTAIAEVGDGNARADLEGVTLATGPNNTGYLVVSNQGADDYSIYDRQTNEHIRNFSIGSNGSIDGVTDTDGVAISTANLGPGFEKGALVVHDASNSGSSTSNLKYIPLE